MADHFRVGVVTVTYNSESVIEGFLSSMMAQNCEDFVLYVVDNASADRTREYLDQYRDERIKIIPNRENLGVAHGNNLGIRAALAAHCNSILLINNDTEFGPELLRDLQAGLQDCHCDMIAPKIVYYADSKRVWYAGGFFNPWRGYAGEHVGLGELDRGQFEKTHLVEYAPTCCMLVRSTVFEKLGLMDEQYFVYADDSDFCFRANRSGVRLVYLSTAEVMHKVSSLTGGGQSVFTLRHLTRSHVYFIRKNLGFWKSMYYLPAYQFMLCYKLLLRILDWEGFVIREKAFFEGARVPLPKQAVLGVARSGAD
jgi:GT2 family glycosyltransferase